MISDEELDRLAMSHLPGDVSRNNVQMLRNFGRACSEQDELPVMCYRADDEDPAEVLRKHNDWRRAEVLTPAPHDSETVSIAISMVLAELHLLRKRAKGTDMAITRRAA